LPTPGSGEKGLEKGLVGPT
jgi:hypothetical protein